MRKLPYNEKEFAAALAAAFDGITKKKIRRNLNDRKYKYIRRD